jgi:thiol-disulfide isomerase/thioredoxin
MNSRHGLERVVGIIAATCVCVEVPLAAAAARSPDIAIKPAVIALAGPPAGAHRSTCVIRHDGEGTMRILAAKASDAALSVSWKEDVAGRIFVLTVTIPAGFQTAPGAPAEVVVTTDLKDEPEIRIPVRVGSGRRPQDWLQSAEALIGQPAPRVVLETLDGGRITFGGGAEGDHKPNGRGLARAVSASTRPAGRGVVKASGRAGGMVGAVAGEEESGQRVSGKAVGQDTGSIPVPHQAGTTDRISVPHQGSQTHETTGNIPVPHQAPTTGRIPVPHEGQTTGSIPGPHAGSKMTAVMFWTPWCEHCVQFAPAFGRLHQAYAERGVEFVTVATAVGRRSLMARAAERVGLDLPVGLDLGRRAAVAYGVYQYPVFVLINSAGTIEAVHGRRGPSRLPKAYLLANHGDPSGDCSAQGASDEPLEMETILGSQLDALLADKPRPETARPPAMTHTRPS